MKNWFGRQPAVLVTQINAGIVAVLLLFRLPDTTTAAIAGVTTAIGGVIIAVVVARDGVLAALISVARATVTLAVVLGVDWDPAYQIMLITAFETVAGIIIRDRVTAPVDEFGQRRQRYDGVTRSGAGV
jgi:hypothetical protein